MTFEAREQICPDITGGMFPGLFWLEGQDYLNAWKTDPNQAAWNTTGKAEIDIAEWWIGEGATADKYSSSTNCIGAGGRSTQQFSTATDFSAGMHVFSVQWKPGSAVTFFRDGSQTFQALQATGNVPASGCSLFLMLYLQILAGSATATQSCVIDYVRVYDQNLG
jgi:hypothetical protein